jgi:uncharacterized protein (DUF433 family)
VDNFVFKNDHYFVDCGGKVRSFVDEGSAISAEKSDIIRKINNNQKMMTYQNIITIESGKRSGKPCIRGMRITVYDILEYLAGGMTEEEILEDFSELTSEDIKACLAFAAEREKKLFVSSL